MFSSFPTIPSNNRRSENFFERNNETKAYPTDFRLRDKHRTLTGIGTLPAGVTEYKSPTGIVWILGRIYCTGTPDDYGKVHALQDKFSLAPLSYYSKPYTPLPGGVDNNLDMKTAVRDQVDALSANDYFNYLAKLMKTNPPAAADAPMVATMAKIGLVPGAGFRPQ